MAEAAAPEIGASDVEVPVAGAPEGDANAGPAEPAAVAAAADADVTVESGGPATAAPQIGANADLAEPSIAAPDEAAAHGVAVVSSENADIDGAAAAPDVTVTEIPAAEAPVAADPEALLSENAEASESAGVRLATAADAVGLADEQAEPLEPPAAALPPPDEVPAEIVIVYVDGGTGGTRVKLGKEGAGGAVSISDLGKKLAALRSLRPETASADTDASAVRAEFFSSFKDCLSSASSAVPVGGITQVVLGLTLWYRQLSDEDRVGFENVWDEMRKCTEEIIPGCSFQVLHISGEDEARFENRAATHAATQVLGTEVDSVISLGAGSIQCTCSPKRGGASCSFTLKLKDGEEMVAADESGLQAWEQTCVNTCVEQLAPCAAGWTSTEEPEEASPHVLLSGACWYAAIGAGLAKQDGPSPEIHGLTHTLQKLKDTAANPDNDLVLRSNTVRLYASLETLFRAASEHSRSLCKVVFGKIWTINNETFKVTWASGHLLEAMDAKQDVANKSAENAGTQNVDEREDAAQVAVEHEDATNPEQQGAASEIPVPDALIGESQPVPSLDADAVAADNPFVIPADSDTTDKPLVTPQSSRAAGAVTADPLSSPISFQPSEQHAKQASKVDGDVSGLVVYVVAPAAAATGEPALSGDEYRCLSAAAVRSGAAIVLSVSAPSAVAALDLEVARRSKILRQVSAFADSRFKAPGSLQGIDSDLEAPLQNLFEALSTSNTDVLDAETVALGLREMGFQGDSVGAAAALTPEGSNRVARSDFVNTLISAVEQPDLVAICPKRDFVDETVAASVEDAWPTVRQISVDAGLTSRESLQAKAMEACRLAGGLRSGHPSSHGVVLVLAGRSRSLLQPADYENHIRRELHVAAEMLPPRWPLLWSPGPAELGLLSETAVQRPVWAMPKSAGPDALISWLRYLLVVRPTAPASNTIAAH